MELSQHRSGWTHMSLPGHETPIHTHSHVNEFSPSQLKILPPTLWQPNSLKIQDVPSHFLPVHISQILQQWREAQGHCLLWELWRASGRKKAPCFWQWDSELLLPAWRVQGDLGESSIPMFPSSSQGLTHSLPGLWVWPRRLSKAVDSPVALYSSN